EQRLRVRRALGNARVWGGVARAGLVRPRGPPRGHDAHLDDPHPRRPGAAARSVRAVRALGLLVGLLILGAAAVAAAAEPRFFVAGDGTLDIASKHLGERVTVRYRRDDGTYDYDALGRIRHLLRCRGDGYEAELTPRFVELLGYLNLRSGRPLVLLSGFRSPSYNDGVRRRGLPASRDSLHTEGIAADLAFPRDLLEPLWLGVRDLGCCGAGYYAREGFLHVDVGLPRYWEPSTSRVDEDLSGGNARIFARTDFDRYVPGEMMLVRFHAVTLPPVRIERTARLVAHGDGNAATRARGQRVHRGRSQHPAAGEGRAGGRTRADRLHHLRAPGRADAGDRRDESRVGPLSAAAPALRPRPASARCAAARAAPR